MAKFDLGRVVATPGVLERFTQDQLIPIIFRHAEGDWGDVCHEDGAANNRAIGEGTRLMSAYTVEGTHVWIITEWDRSVTTILLPEEY